MLVNLMKQYVDIKKALHGILKHAMSSAVYYNIFR